MFTTDRNIQCVPQYLSLYIYIYLAVLPRCLTLGEYLPKSAAGLRKFLDLHYLLKCSVFG